MTLNFFSCASLPFVYLLGKCLFKSFARFFKIELFVFDLWLNTLFTMHELQPFLSHPVGFPFISLMRTFFEASEFPHFDQVKCISFFASPFGIMAKTFISDFGSIPLHISSNF